MTQPSTCKNYISRLSKILPTDYNQTDYDKDKKYVKEIHEQFKETQSIPLSYFVSRSNVTLYKYLMNMYFFLGLFTYNEKYVLTEKQSLEFKSILKEIEAFEKYL